jgi:hypothetical protein
MKNPFYVQIFSITDHTQPLQGRYQGPYQGINAELQTTEVKNGKLLVAQQTKSHQATIPENYLDEAEVVLAYRHSDTGVLTGTSETLFSISKTPWDQMPGFSVISADEKSVIISMWDQEMSIEPNRVYQIRFGKTVVYMKNFGQVNQIEWTDKILAEGPAQLHSADVQESITIAPSSGSRIQVKMGQETQN